MPLWGMEMTSRVGSLRGTEAPPKPVYYASNAIVIANMGFPFARALPWAAVPAQAIVDRYEQDDGTAARVGQNLRVPLLRQGPYCSTAQKKIMSTAVTCFSILTILPPFQSLWFVSGPLGMYVSGFEVVDGENAK